MQHAVYRPGSGRPTSPNRARTALACALLLALFAAPCVGEGLLYRVRGDSGQAWLLGSLHFGSDDLYPLSEPVERAFAAADRIMVEVNLLDLPREQVTALMETKGSYPPQDALRRNVSEHLWQRLFRVSRGLGLPVATFERQRPWLAALTLTTAYLERHGLTPAQGVDRHFMRRARRAGLPILELETFGSQIALLAGIPASEQVLMLEDTLGQVESDRSLPMDLLLAWRTGDRRSLERLLVEGLGSGEQGRALARRLLHERNGPMAERVSAEVTRGGTVFVVVGAAHMLGDSGLPAQLTRRGLDVQAR